MSANANLAFSPPLSCLIYLKTVSFWKPKPPKNVLTFFWDHSGDLLQIKSITLSSSESASA